MSETCMIFFNSEQCDFNKALESLKSYGLNTLTNGKSIVANHNSSPKFEINMVNENHVLDDAIKISKGTEFESKMSKCNVRFEIKISNLNEALNEINTLMEVQGALQDASKGYLFTPWNNNISEPWTE